MLNTIGIFPGHLPICVPTYLRIPISPERPIEVCCHASLKEECTSFYD